MQTLPGARQEYKLAPSVLLLSRARGTSHPLPSVEKQMAAPVGGEGREEEGAWGWVEKGVEEERNPSSLPWFGRGRLWSWWCALLVGGRCVQHLGQVCPKPFQGDQLSTILLLFPRASEAVDFRGGDSMYSDPGCSLGVFLPLSKTVHA